MSDTASSVLLRDLDDHLGRPWEEAMRIHLRRLANEGVFGDDIVAVGPFWTAASQPVEIDAVVLAGRQRAAAALAEATWAKRANGASLRHDLERKLASLPRVAISASVSSDIVAPGETPRELSDVRPERAVVVFVNRCEAVPSGQEAPLSRHHRTMRR